MKFQLTDKQYDVLKWALFIFVPALIGLIGGLAELYDYDAQTLMTLISLIATFLGAITGISSHNYNKEEEAE